MLLYERKIWHYNQTNVDHIKEAAYLFLWEKSIAKSQHKRYDFFI